MSDLQAIIDDISSFLQSADRTSDDGLRQVAAKYAKACEEANGRMRRCGELLKEGLRGEAIHLADAHPKLLDLYALLDFAGRDEWDEAVAAYDGFPRAPALLLELAEALNRAYLEIQPVDELLRRHRLLAWARAPLGPRLEVMRAVATLDAQTSFWDQDIRACEQLRLKEIACDAERATSAKSADKLDLLLGELENGSWREPVEQCRKRVLRVCREAFRTEQFPRWERDLAGAFAGKDVARGRALRTKLLKAADKVCIDPDDPIWNRVQRPLDWLQRHDDFDDALEALTDAITSCDRQRDLAAMYRRARQFKLGIPKDLEALYEQRLSGFRNDAFERRWLVAVIVPGVLLVAALIAAVLFGWL